MWKGTEKRRRGAFGECLTARAAGWTTASEWRQATGPISTAWPSVCPLCPPLGPWPLWLLPPLVGQMPKSGVWGLASGSGPSIFPHTHTRLRHAHSGCRTSNSSPDVFNHGETSLCLVAWNRPGLDSRTSLTRRPRLSSPLLASPRLGPSSWLQLTSLPPISHRQDGTQESSQKVRQVPLPHFAASRGGRYFNRHALTIGPYFTDPTARPPP